jgi:hypothetical protein
MAESNGKRKAAKKIRDLILDQNNANKGTEYGRSVLENSLRKFGAGRSILIDKKGRVIAGNKTAEIANEIGIENLVVVKTKGDQIVAVQREDLDLEEDPEARQMAYADNRTGQLGLEWDIEQMKFDVDKGLDLTFGWSKDELALIDSLIPDGNKELDEEAMGQTEHECPSCGFTW